MVSDLNKLIFNGQKQIKIVDRYKDVWQVVEEYQSDELGSVLEDENKLKKAKEAGDRKGKQDKRVNASKISGRKLFMLPLTTVVQVDDGPLLLILCLFPFSLAGRRG